MKNLNLENFGVQEMNAKEMRNENGGNWFYGWVIEGLIDAATDWDGAVASFNRGVKAAK
ncbi:hypothetical protein GJU39_14965 [Pedobacter petrophilus]|uniref:Uncharacterized protein n=1 Tax=Pedobacter petrophilus TaxID=1908241 RepID=A0A7K0G329_9SPHI|nr:hypothetical protein [Pedobacter petrophilus]MRX77386.1 hypothetical protein [Pedobacter petrophilus]